MPPPLKRGVFTKTNTRHTNFTNILFFLRMFYECCEALHTIFFPGAYKLYNDDTENILNYYRTFE